MTEQSSETASRGIVYVLSNVAMPNYIKIGMTSGNSPNDVEKRMTQLDTTGVPRQFNCEHAAVVENPERVEKVLHIAFDKDRVRPSREFFEGVAPYRAKAILELLQITDVTPGATGQGENDTADKEKPPKEEKFKFSMVDILPGERLQWADDPEIECEVVNEKTRVAYGGREYAISTLAKELKGWKFAARGPLYWLYQGETLQERRERFERDEDSKDE